MKKILIPAFLLLFTGCDEDPPQADPPAGWLPIPAELTNFDTEDLPAWVKEGRPAEFEGRQWVPFGDPLFNITPQPAGQFESTALYTEPTDLPPHERLFVPLEDDHWLVLVPRETIPGLTQSGETLAPPGGTSQD